MTARSRSRRPVSNRASKFQIRVYAEGQKTEEGYITHLWRRNREHVVVSIAKHVGSTPLKLVKTAAAERKADLRAAKKTGAAFDEYWCIFDVDEHPHLSEALDMAAANDIKVALSSPCLELWFLIHFVHRGGYVDRHQAQKLAAGHLDCAEKTLTPGALELLDNGYGAAVANAQALDAMHAGNGSDTPWNPSSNVWELTETIARGKTVEKSGVPFSRSA